MKKTVSAITLALIVTAFAVTTAQANGWETISDRIAKQKPAEVTTAAAACSDIKKDSPSQKVGTPGNHFWWKN